MRLFLLFIFLGSFTFQTHAGILLEPYAGYHLGSYKDGTKKDLKGLSYGARLGADVTNMAFGIDFMMGSWEDDADPSADWKPQDIGVFFAFNGGVARFYAAYLIDAENKKTENGSTSKYEGSGIKLGVGFPVASVAYLNLEYLAHTYEERNGSTLGSDINTKLFALTFSFPFTF